MTKGRSAVVQVVQIKEVPIQTPFEEVKGMIKGIETDFEQRTQKFAEMIGIEVETYEILSHDWKQSVVNFAEEQKSDLILMDWEEEFHHELMHGSDVHWIMDHAPCDVTVFKDRGIAKIGDILLTTTSDIYDNVKVRMANSIALAKNTTVTFFKVVDPELGGVFKRNIRRYHEILKKNCVCASKSMIVESTRTAREIIRESKNHGLIILSASEPTTEYGKLKDAIFGHLEDRIIKRVDCSVLITKHRENNR